MKIFYYIYYRMYEAYSEKKDSPLFRTFMYMTLLFFCIIGIMFIYLEKIILATGILVESNIIAFKKSYFFWGLIIICTLAFTFLVFSRKKFVFYEQTFSKYTILNRSIKIWMLIVIPFFLLFSSIGLFIFLFGGEILGIQIKGLF